MSESNGPLSASIPIEQRKTRDEERPGSATGLQRVEAVRQCLVNGARQSARAPDDDSGREREVGDARFEPCPGLGLGAADPRQLER